MSTDARQNVTDVAAAHRISSRMPDRIVHVGLGKTATTSLQHVVFPRVAEHAHLEYFGCDSNESILRHRAQLYLQGRSDERSDALGPRFLVSCENLVGWDPYWWDAYAEGNRRFFGAEATVLLTVREPRSWLTSVYLQMCLHQGDVLAPDAFFLPSEIYSPYLGTPKFHVDSFGYQSLVDAYSSRFQRVIVVPMERLPQLDFLAELVDTSNLDLGPLRSAFASYKANRAYSARAVRWTRQFDRRLRSLGLALAGTQSRSAQKDLRAIRATPLAPAHAGWSRPGPTGELRTLTRRLGARVVRELHWRHFVQQRLDRVLPYKLYELDFESLPWIPLQELEREYRLVADKADAVGSETETLW